MNYNAGRLFHTIPAKDPNGYLRKAREYQVWRTHQDPAKAIPAPIDYRFIHDNPGRFKAAEEAFNLHWAVKRLTK